MPIYHFHVQNNETLMDADGTELADDRAARAHARGVVQELKFRSPGMLGEDWSAWSMVVHDADDAELFSFPFADVEERDE